jgi:hypothetical protein
MNNKVDKAFVIGSFILFVLAVTLLSYFEYQEQKKNFYERIDGNLLAAVKGTDLILIAPLKPHPYHRTNTISI